MRKVTKKNLYNVYLVRNGTGVYASHRIYVGQTWASSKEQAENNVRYRINGAVPSMEIIGDRLEQGSVAIYYEAELAEE